MSTDLVKQESAVRAFDFFNADQFAVMQRVCTMFANSELVPDMYRTSEKNPEKKAIANCMIAVEMSSRIGASPLMVMQNLYIVYGRPGWSSKFLIACVNACGRFETMDFKIVSKGMIKDVEFTDYKWDDKIKRKVPVISKYPKELDNLECIAFTRELKSGKLLESPPVSIELAIQEGWYQKDGSKWRTMTRLMLMYRAATFWTNTHAPELSMGIKTSDELEDYIPYEEITLENKVGAEIKEKANSKPIGMDEQSATNSAIPPSDNVGESSGNGAQNVNGSTDTKEAEQGKIKGAGF